MRAVSEIEVERAFAKKRDALRHEEYFKNPVEVRWTTERLVEYMLAELEEVRKDILGRAQNSK